MSFTSAVNKYLREKGVGRFASATLNGVPHIVAVGYVNDDSNVYFSTLTATKKVRNIRKNGKVAFIVDDSDVPEGWRYVIVEGDARVIPHGLEFDKVRKMLCVKYPSFESVEWAINEETHSLIHIKPRKIITANL